MVKRKNVRESYGVPYMHSSGSSSYRSSRSGSKRQKLVILAPNSQAPAQPTFGERVASAAVGGVVGNVPGAIYGAAFPFIKFPKKNMPGGRSMSSVVNSRVDKSSMKVTGKAKVKKQKTVKVSPYLKKAIKQVSAGQAATGLYKRTIQGVVGYGAAQGTGAFDFEVTSLAIGTTQIQALLPSADDKSVGHKSLFNSLCLAAVGDNVTPVAHCDMNFFTPAKIWHAASVLFNDKAENNNPYASTADNLSLGHNDTTGATAEPNAQNLKIHLQKSYVKFNLKNLSARTVHIDIYECVPMTKWNSNNPLQDMYNLSTQVQDNGAETRVIGMYEGGAEVTITNNSRFITDGITDTIALCKSLGWKWKYVKRTMMLSPGENCEHVMSGPSGIIDYNKTFDAAFVGVSSGYNTFGYRTLCNYKDMSKSVIMAVRADPALFSAGVNNGARYAPLVAGKSTLGGLVSVEATEVMSIKVPEIAGFVTKAVTAGAPQTLNLRRKRYQFTNLTPLFNNETTNLVASSEFNPVASVNQGSSLSLM